MEKLVRVLVFEGITGTNYTYQKGENEMPEHHAADIVAAGHGQYLDKKPPENAASRQAAGAEKRSTKK